MELTHLKSFYYVAREGGFTKAARVLHVQQPAISKSVSQLESTLGVKLLERQRRKVLLTKVGAEVFAECDEIFRRTERIKEIAEGERFTCQGPLAFGASDGIASHAVPRVHASYLADHPNVVPFTVSAPAETLYQAVIAGEIEFGLLFYAPPEPAGITLRRVAMVDFSLVISAEKARSRETKARFIGSREVHQRGARRFPTIARMRRDIPETRIVISSNNINAHKMLVLEGLGVSILPTFMVTQELADGRLKRLYPRETFRFPMKIAARAGTSLSRNARVYVEYLEDIFS